MYFARFIYTELSLFETDEYIVRVDRELRVGQLRIQTKKAP